MRRPLYTPPPEGPQTEQTLPATGLDDLPDHRREYLLWRHGVDLDRAELDEQLRARSPSPCRWNWVRPVAGEQTAVLGSDGRYHLVDATGEMVCEERRLRPYQRPKLPENVILHRQRLSWWTDGEIYRRQRPSGVLAKDSSDAKTVADVKQRGSRDHRWTFTITDTITDPAVVPHKARCPVDEARRDWPPFRTEDTKLGRIRIHLIDTFGAECHACRRRPGTDVDHDQLAGWVRGLCCWYCNQVIDTCPHPSGCVWAAYLNDPPALPLKIRYPRMNQALRRHDKKVAAVGYDPFAHLRPRDKT